MNFENLTAFEAARLIKEEKLTSTQLVSFYIDQIKKWNPYLNAVVETCFDQALAQAKDCDQTLEKLKNKNPESLPVLWGVPFTMKEMFAVQGMKSTSGSFYLKNQTSIYDAAVVTRLKNAGAILLGTTNVPEIGLWFETYNRIYGTTNNPYNLKHSVGGSSGGEAAIIGAGASLFGVGSDIGGSIRLPAAACGIYGHKPTWKSVPMTGHPPFSPEMAHQFSGSNYPMTTAGPMCKSAKDLRPLMEILMGPDGVDPECLNNFKLKPPLNDFSKLKVYKLSRPEISLARKTSTEQYQAVEKAADILEKQGAQIIELSSSLFQEALLFWTAKLSLSKNRSLQLAINPDSPVQYWKEFMLAPLKKSKHTLPILVSGFLEKYFGHSKVTEGKIAKSLLELQALSDKLNQLLRDDGIILMPTFPTSAPRHGKPLSSPFDYTYTGIFNALGFPATAGTMGIGEHGLPTSVQLIATPGNDHLTLSAMELLETHCGGWVPPKSLPT